MCKAFSCIIDPANKVTWELGTDSHSDLATLGGYKDQTLGEFAKIEITPKNNDYLNPDEWVFRVDESPVPAWFDPIHGKEACLAAHKKWAKQLDKFIIRHEVVKPFGLAPPPEITKAHIRLLKKWASVRASVRASVGASVGDSVRASVGDLVWASVGDSVRASVGASVWASVRASVGDSVWASVWAYAGSFFRIPVGKYPYQALVSLWNKGLVPSFDGTTWRLHGGPKAGILYSIAADDLKNWKG